VTDMAFMPMRKGPPKAADAVDRIKPNLIAHPMSDPFDIADTLTTLAASGEPLTVYPLGQERMLARIDGVDADRKRFALDLVGDAVLPEGRTVFVASLGGNAKIQFELDPDWAIIPGKPHLVCLPFPGVCQVLNRRIEERLDTPVGGNYGARFSVQGKLVDMPLYDFSRGGVGLRATPDQALDLYVGKKLMGVELDLGAALMVTADLEIRLLRPFRTFLLGPQVQVGCRISNISMQMRQSLDRAVSTVQRRRY
jgi:c-di-GMP-binding flagellar brake protein YcgR